jgi:hypothetical protein
VIVYGALSLLCRSQEAGEAAALFKKRLHREG